MSFQDIKKLSTSNENVCAILYNFNNKELTMLKNICGLFIVLKYFAAENRF